MMEWHADFAAWEIMSGHMFRTRFRQQIVTEFLPPPRHPRGSKADHPVQRYALDSAQAAAIGISLCWKILYRSEKVASSKENSIIRGTTEMKSRRRGFWWFTRKLNPHVPYETSSRFAGSIGVTLQSLHWGGHLSRDDISRKYWAQIRKFSTLSPS